MQLIDTYINTQCLLDHEILPEGTHRIRLTRRVIDLTRRWCQDVRSMRYKRDMINRDSGIEREHNEVIGRLSEIAACIALGGTLYDDVFSGKPMLPSWELFETGSNYRDADFGGNFHVKACKRDLVEPTWLANVSDPIVNDGEGQYIVLCQAVDFSIIDVLGLVKAPHVIDDWKDPMADMLKGRKKALYLSDIKWKIFRF